MFFIVIGMLLSFFLLSQPQPAPCSAITFDYSNDDGQFFEGKKGGRFGDKLYMYARAKLLALKYNIPLLYNPGEPYLDQLVMSKKELLLTTDLKTTFSTIADLRDKHESIKRDSNTLYVYNFYIKVSRFGVAEFSTLRNPKFLTIMRQMVKPLKPLKGIVRPKGKISIALHVRKGSNNDLPLLSRSIKQKYHDVLAPLKFPPDSYYIDQIRKLSDFFYNLPLYVHLFTDAKNPTDIINKYKKILNNRKIAFATRLDNNDYDKHVLEDFFAMTQFDCLIRPDSGFSIWAQLLGNHKIVISPRHAYWEKDRLIVDDVNVEGTWL